MHESNMKYWEHARAKYPRYFTAPSKVVEFGSFNINGTVRDVFKCDHYIGVDWLAGPCVDVVSLAHEVNFDYQFDTVISASMLEHDPYWEQSLAKMISVMKDDGILLLSWGAAMNGPHCTWSAPDKKHHALKVDKVLNFLRKARMFVDEFRYECGFMGTGKFDQYAVLIAFKDEKYSIEPHIIDERHPEDIEAST